MRTPSLLSVPLIRELVRKKPSPLKTIKEDSPRRKSKE